MNDNFGEMCCSDGTESGVAHDDWGQFNGSAYTPGWDGDC